MAGIFLRAQKEKDIRTKQIIRTTVKLETIEKKLDSEICSLFGEQQTMAVDEETEIS